MSTTPKINGPVLFRMVIDGGGACEVRGYPFPVVHDLSIVPGSKGRRYPLSLTTNRVSASDIPRKSRSRAGGWWRPEALRILLTTGLPRTSCTRHGAAQWQVSTDTRASVIEFIEPGEAVQVNGRRFTGPVLIAREARLENISIMASGGAAVEESSVLVEGSLAYELFENLPMPTHREILAASASQRETQKLAASSAWRREQIELPSWRSNASRPSKPTTKRHRKRPLGSGILSPKTRSGRETGPGLGKALSRIATRSELGSTPGEGG